MSAARCSSALGLEPGEKRSVERQPQEDPVPIPCLLPSHRPAHRRSPAEPAAAAARSSLLPLMSQGQSKEEPGCPWDAGSSWQVQLPGIKQCWVTAGRNVWHLPKRGKQREVSMPGTKTICKGLFAARIPNQGTQLPLSCAYLHLPKASRCLCGCQLGHVANRSLRLCSR